MRRESYLRTVAMLLAGSTVLVIGLAAQTPDAPSIAEAARRSREQKKDTPKTTAVITNETLTPAAASSSPVTAPQPGQAGDSANGIAPTDATAAGAPPKQELSPEASQKLKDEIATVKEQMKDKQVEVAVLQRLLKLDRDAELSKPDSTHDTAGQVKLATEQNELKEKQEEFDKLKSKLESLAPQEESTASAPPQS
jgi:hypothetical protein